MWIRFACSVLCVYGNVWLRRDPFSHVPVSCAGRCALISTLPRVPCHLFIGTKSHATRKSEPRPCSVFSFRFDLCRLRLAACWCSARETVSVRPPTFTLHTAARPGTNPVAVLSGVQPASTRDWHDIPVRIRPLRHNKHVRHDTFCCFFAPLLERQPSVGRISALSHIQ